MYSITETDLTDQTDHSPGRHLYIMIIIIIDTYILKVVSFNKCRLYHETERQLRNKYNDEEWLIYIYIKDL